MENAILDFHFFWNTSLSRLWGGATSISDDGLFQDQKLLLTFYCNHIQRHSLKEEERRKEIKLDASIEQDPEDSSLRGSSISPIPHFFLAFEPVGIFRPHWQRPSS